MEKYEEAAESRFDDWEILSKGENRRKACSIHLGGIYIECLLKGMLCSQCSVTAGTNISQWIINGHTQKRPGHGLNINIYTSYLSDVYDDMSEDMLEALEYLDSPEGIGYIDYRYISEDEVDGLTAMIGYRSLHRSNAYGQQILLERLDVTFCMNRYYYIWIFGAKKA
jgi:hypothetical protein